MYILNSFEGTFNPVLYRERRKTNGIPFFKSYG